MTSVPGERLGVQRPRVCEVPRAASSAAAEAIDLARIAGLDLDPWQQFVLEGALGERPDGKWAAFEVGLVVSRQNGKGAILEARELAGLFLLGERLIIHSAHQFDTSLEAFRRLLGLIEDNTEFSKRVRKVSRSHGEEGIELKSGQRIRFRTRTKGGGRGFSGDCLILDEAMDLPETAHGALLPTLSARPNPQVWYTGSAVDQEVHDHGRVLARVRERGLSGDEPGLAYFEWSADADLRDMDGVATDPDAWAQANPGLGIRISLGHIELEQRSMDPRTFAVERLGIGDWPSLDVLEGQAIDRQMWASRADAGSSMTGPVVFSFDVRPDRSSSSICAAGERPDGLWHVEVVEHRPGTGWVPERLEQLVERHQTLALVCDQASPAASLLPRLKDAEVPVVTLNAKEYAQACGAFFDAVEQGEVRHLDQPALRTATSGAVRRPLGDAWAWSRKGSNVDISPLVAATLALWKAMAESESVYEDRDLLIL